MDLLVLNQNFESVSVLDNYTSLIWTDRYYEYGDFELCIPMSIGILDYVKEDNYLYLKSSDHMMIIENIEIETDVENGSMLKVTGRSLESILTRRIVWGQKKYSGNVNDIIKNLIMDAIINPDISERKIDNFVFVDCTDESVSSVELEAQYTGDNLYSIVSGLCSLIGSGFKITLNESNQFVFQLYSGSDRSYEQDTNPYVVFSPTFENIIEGRYIETSASYKNVTLVAGEGEGSDRKTFTIGDVSGLNRRELFTDARDISSNTTDGILTDEEYNAQLKTRGESKLQEYKKTTSFDGKVDAITMFVYGKDFFIGDIVQIVDEYGHEGRSYITEIIYSKSDSGEEIYPTFETVY